jgi:hypothetical protein
MSLVALSGFEAFLEKHEIFFFVDQIGSKLKLGPPLMFLTA